MTVSETNARFGEAFASIARCRALLVGDVMLDAYLYGETVRVSREAPVLVVKEERIEYRLGGAANTAANLAALGVDTTLLAPVGVDAEGQRLLSLLRERQIATGSLLTVDAVTPIKTRILAGAFAAGRQQVLRLDREPQSSLLPEQLEELAERLLRDAENVDVIIVSDYGNGATTGPVLEALHALAQRGHRVCVDSRYRLKDFVGMTVLTPNVPEAELALGYSLHTQPGVHRAGKELLEIQQCGACLITQGQSGMTLFAGSEAPRHVDIVGTEEVTDVTGAGDAVIATMGAALAAGLGLVNGMLLANCAAGIVVTRMGTTSASPLEITSAALQSGVELEQWANV